MLGSKSTTTKNAILGAVETNPESKSFNQAMATGERRAKAIIDKYKKPGEIDTALAAVKDFWKSYNAKTIVRSPEEAFDISFNYWNKYQSWVTANWSLMDSYYIGGGSATIGFRDMCQHIIRVLPNPISLF